MNIDISIVLIAHKESWIIYPTIASILQAKQFAENQGLTIEIIVIVDQPDKSTIDFIFSNIPIEARCESVNFGDLGSSRNHAITLANGKYVAFIDGDDLWSKNWLVEAYNLAQSSTTNIILHPEANIFFGKNTSLFFHRSMSDKEFIINVLFYTNYWTSSSFSNRSTYEAVPYKIAQVDKGFAWEDWEWNLETIINDFTHEIVPGTTHFIRKKSDSSLLEYITEQHCIPILPDNFLYYIS